MLENNRKEKQYNLLIYIVIFLCIIIDTSFFTVNKVDGFVRVAADFLVVFIASIIIYKGKIHIDSKCASYGFLFISFVIINGLLFKNVKQTIILSIFVCLSIILRSMISKDEFFAKYSNILVFLALFSIITYIIYLIAPGIIRLLPKISRGYVGGYYNAGFSIIWDNSYAKRNFGIFWEPGAFAVFLNIALYIEIFKREQNIRRIAVLSIAIITTLSTTGIVCMIVLFVATLFKHNSEMNKYIKAVIVLALLIGVYFTLNYGDYFIYHVFGKLSGIGTGSMNQTTSVRMDSIEYPGRFFLRSPLWGIGFNNFLSVQDEYCRGMATFTFINWLCIYGVIGGFLPICGVIKFFTPKGESFITRCLLIAFSVFLFFSENFVQIEFIYLLFLFGVSGDKQHE